MPLTPARPREVVAGDAVPRAPLLENEEDAPPGVRAVLERMRMLLLLFAVAQLLLNCCVSVISFLKVVWCLFPYRDGSKIAMVWVLFWVGAARFEVKGGGGIRGRGKK